MQNPQYSFMGKQSSGSVSGESYSVLQNTSSVAKSQIESVTKSQTSANVSQQTKRIEQPSPFDGTTHNFSDQLATTWQWSAQAQTSQPVLPIEEPPRVEYVPFNDRSFAPPADLGQLQRVGRPQVQQQFTSDIYKSPIDRPYVGRPRKTVESLEATAQSNSMLPERDEVTKIREFLTRDGASEAFFVEPQQQENAPDTGKHVIVLQSQSPQELAKASGRETTSSPKPDAQLLTPNFESYVGSPVLDTTREVYREQTKWKAYTPKPEVVNLPPPAIFESQPKFSVKTPVVEYSPPTNFESKPKVSAKTPVVKYFPPTTFESEPKVSAKAPVVKNFPPARTNHDFEPAQEVAGLPEPPAPKPTIKKDLFQAPPAPVKANDVFGATSVKVDTPSQFEHSVAAKPVATDYRRDTSVNQVIAARAKSTTPSYRFERYETDSDVGTNTQAITVAHTTPVAPAATETAWLSPWWMLVCLIPMAMYLMTRRGSAVDEYYDACDEVGERPRLPPEMIEKPGYSKSDAIYGDKDEYFATEQVCSNKQCCSITDRLPMTTHLKTAGHTKGELDDLDDLEGFLREETVTTDSSAERHFAGSNAVQTDTELDGDASPNFRSQLFDVEDDDDDETPDWLR